MPRRLLRVALYVGAVCLVVVILALAAAFLTPQGRAVAKTVGLVAEVLPDSPVHPLRWFTKDPERTPITFPGPKGEAQADIYRIPDGRPRAAVVLFLGVNPAGRDDERVVNLSMALARTGYVVLVPWSENMVGGRVDSSDIETLVSAFEYLKTLDYVDPDRIGSGGFCVGSSLLTIAAADPRIRDDVRFVNFFSGYYDAWDYLAQYGARQAFYQGETRPWDVDPLTDEVFTRLLIEQTPNEADRAALTRHFDEGLPLTAEEVEALSPEALAAFRLLSGTTLEEARALIEQLPAQMQGEMDRLSPRNYVDDLRADLWIMHDVDDKLAPVEESYRLYDAVRERDNVTFTEFSFFQHVDPGKDVGPLGLVGESWKLLRHLYRVVRMAS